MTISIGTEAYNVDHQSVRGRGLCLNDEEMEAALNGPVSAIIRDDSGMEQIEELLMGVTETDFQASLVQGILNNDRRLDDWRVGEAIAESYLIVHHQCCFPWPIGRDQKDPNASMPGTDLVGFQRIDDDQRPFRFAFGEVKTSSDSRRPPSVVYGRHGLKEQLQDLRDKKQVRNDLMMYLAWRAFGSSWQGHFRSATGRFLDKSEDVTIFGVMIRDVKPDERDLRARVERLADECPAVMVIELLALYLPLGAIAGLGKRVMLNNKEGGYARN